MERPAGFLLIDKPAGMTSHDVVNRVRRATGERTVGHAGTLDPFATGLLLVGVGRPATREFPNLVGLDKEYEAVFAFGATSDTDDRTGTVTPHPGARPVSAEEIRAALPRFVGEIEQIPPAYAAIKVGGKKMYEAARAGAPIAAPPRRVRVTAFELLDAAEKPHTFSFRIACGSGTYIRALARDLGAALGVGGYVEELRRTKVGPFPVAEAVPLADLSPETAVTYLHAPPALLARLSPPPAPATLGA